MKPIIIIKIGSNAILDEHGEIDNFVMENISQGIIHLREQGKKVILVSSGAVGAAHSEISPQVFGKISATERSQILSSIGQPLLMKRYREVFQKYNIPIAQGLVTRSDFASRERQIHMRETMLKLLKGGVLPILNENDFLMPDKLDFSDNDQLACYAAGMMCAEYLVLLSNIDGLFTGNPKDPEAQKIHEIDEITPKIESYIVTEKSNRGTGGMGSKIRAAKILSQLGIGMVLANSREKKVLEHIEQKKKVGTRFHPVRDQKASGIRVWLAAGAAEMGNITLDCPLEKIIKQKKTGTSLLGVGIRHISGSFEAGDAIGIISESGEHVGKGVAKISSGEMWHNIGKKGVIFVHADNLFLL